jgi:hypothetical protein
MTAIVEAIVIGPQISGEFTGGQTNNSELGGISGTVNGGCKYEITLTDPVGGLKLSITDS